MRSLLDSLPICISYFDKEQRFQFNNKTYEEWFGISRTELKGKHISEVIGKKTYESVRGHIEKALSGENDTYETELMKKDGGTRFVQVNLIPHFNNEGDVAGCYTYVRDTSESVRMNDEIQKKLKFEQLIAQLSARFVNMPAGEVDMNINEGLQLVNELVDVDEIFILQFKGGKGESGVTHGCFKSGNVRELEFDASEFTRVFPWAGRKILKNEVIIFENMEEELPAEAVNERKYLREIGLESAVVIPMYAGKRNIGALFIKTLGREKKLPPELVDQFRLIGELFSITMDRKAKADTLAESQSRLSAFMENSPAWIYIKDASYRHIYGNKSLLNLLNLKLHEFIGTTSHDFMPEDVANRIEDYDKEVIGKGVPIESDEYNFMTDSEFHHIREIKFPIKLYSGEMGVGGIVMDITALKATEQALSEQLGFERLVADIAMQLAQTKSKQAEETLDWVLQSLGQFLKTERTFLAQFSKDYKSLLFTNTWFADIEMDTSIFHTDIASELPLVAEHFRNGGTMNLGPGLTGIPDELRNRLGRDGINSGLVVPILVEGKSIGMLGLDTVVKAREYPEPIADRLRTVANMIGSLLHRMGSEENLKKAYDEIKLLKERIEAENVYLREQISAQSTHEDIIGESDAIKYVLYKIKQVAPSDATVLILGETGTGKELVAEAIHNDSSRKDGPLIKVNCAALPFNLIESELFGREKGAFTGAMAKQIGRFELADNGTLFLDEIGELPLEFQTKLLRVIEYGEFERLGSPHRISVDVRIIASTNRDLIDEVKKGNFRKDLYYRLNVFPVTIPPLRDRTEDIPLLVNYFLEKFEKKIGRKIERVPYKTMQSLEKYDWPGNVRELENIIERSMIVSTNSTLQLADTLQMPETANHKMSQLKSMKDVELKHILEVLEKTRWKIEGKNGAAESLDLNPSTLRTRMRKLGITRSRYCN